MFLFNPSNEYPKRTESKSIIRFQDCDPLNHLNNAKYFDYYFNSREDQQVLLYGVKSDYSFKTYNYSWVVYQHQIAYIRPANVSEWVTILSSIIYYDQTTKVVEYVMTDEHKKELKNVMWTTSKYISVANGKVMPHHPEIMEYLHATATEGVDFQNLTFNQRIKQIKQELLAGTY